MVLHFVLASLFFSYNSLASDPRFTGQANYNPSAGGSGNTPSVNGAYADGINQFFNKGTDWNLKAIDQGRQNTTNTLAAASQTQSKLEQVKHENQNLITSAPTSLSAQTQSLKQQGDSEFALKIKQKAQEKFVQKIHATRDAISSDMAPHYQTESLIQEIQVWKTPSEEKKKVLDAIPRFSETGKAVKQSQSPYKPFALATFQVGVDFLGDSARIAGGWQGSFEEAMEAAESARLLAGHFLDLFGGGLPVTGPALSAYEFISGRTFNTEEELSTTSRAFAGVNAVLLGSPKVVFKVLSGAAYAVRGTLVVESTLTEALTKTDQWIDRGDRILKGWRKSHRIVAVDEATAVNQRLKEAYNLRAPFQSGTLVFETVLKKESHFVRVHSEGSHLGRWLVKRDSIRGLSAEQIQLKLSLPAKPTHITDVYVPANSRMLRGHASYLRLDSTLPELSRASQESVEGAVQYFLPEFIPIESYRNTRLFEVIQ